MNNEERQALIDVASKRLSQYRKMHEYKNSQVRPRGGIEFQYDNSIALMEIALAALTAMPVALVDKRQGSGGICTRSAFHTLLHGTELFTITPTPIVPDGFKLVPVELTEEMKSQIHPITEATCRNCGSTVVADCEDNVLLSWGDILAMQPVNQSYKLNSPEIPDGLIVAINHLLDVDGSRGCYSAVECHDAREKVERLLAAAPEA